MIFENWEIGPAWFTLSGDTDEELSLTADISERRIIDIKLPVGTTIEHAKQVSADELSELLTTWTTALRAFRSELR